MKLIKCHIDGFGKFNNVSFDFSDGCNSFCQENGWGKTTLSMFIKVMLYGFDNEKKQDITVNERAHYKPWTGEVYGGKLVIEVSGSQYTIMRQFGKKSSEDLLSVHDETNNTETSIFGENIGETLFKINSESFARTVFISEGMCGTVVDSSIGAKLGNVSGAMDDLEGYNKAIQILDKGMQSYKARGKKGSINVADTRMTEISSECKEKPVLLGKNQELEQYIHDNNERIKDFKQRLDAISEIISEESKQKNKRVLKQKYDQLIKNLAERETILADQKRLFPNGIPKQDVLTEYMNICSELDVLAGKSSSYILSDEEKKSLSDLELYFAKQSTSEAQISDWKNDIADIISLNEKIETMDMPRHQRDRLDELSSKYESNCPDISYIDGLQKQLSESTDKKQEIKQKQFILEEKQKDIDEKNDNNKKAVKKTKIACLLIAIFLIILSVTLFSLNINIFISIGAIAVAVIFIIVVLFKKPKIIKDDEILELSDDIAQMQTDIDDINENVYSFCTEYGSDTLESAYALMKIRDEIVEYKKLLEYQNDNSIMIQKEKLSDMVGVLSEKLGLYEVSKVDNYHDFYNIVNNIEKNHYRYASLKDKAEKAYESEKYKNEKSSKLSAFLVSNGFTENDDASMSLQIMNKRLSSYESALSEYEKALKDKELFENENPDYEDIYNMNISSEDVDIEALDTERIQLEENIDILKHSNINYQNQLDQLLERLDELELLEQEYEYLQEKKVDDQKEYDILAKTKDYLEKSKQSFVNKYTGPVKQGFDKYYKALKNEDADNYYLDADMKLSVDVAGFRRKQELLSKGQQDLAGICMRMALVDAMFTDEKPFVIFDDPFANLDTEIVNKGKELLNNMASEYQIIYFTCHESRVS